MTTPQIPDDFLGEFVGEVIRDYLEEQPWWRRYANTVTAAVGGLVTLAAWLLASGLDLPTWALGLVGIVVFAGNVLGIKATRNGVTPSTAAQISAVIEDATYVGRHRLGD